MNKVMIVSWSNPDSAEPANWYQVKDIEEGKRFFQNLIDNAENDGREKLELIFVTQEEWAEAERLGKELA